MMEACFISLTNYQFIYRYNIVLTSSLFCLTTSRNSTSWTSWVRISRQFIDFNASSYFVRKSSQECPWRVLPFHSVRLDNKFHCVKSVQIRFFFWSIFLRFWTEYGKIRTRKSFVFGHFSCSVYQHLRKPCFCIKHI